MQEKGAVTPQETDPDLPMSVQESVEEACCRAGGTDCIIASMGPFEGGRHHIFIISTIVWPQVTGTQSTEDWIKNLLSMALPIRTRPSFPLSLSHQEASISLLTFLRQRADRMEAIKQSK